ncbi:MAG: cytochrome c [Actinomycetota bacterium]|nr:cytochrome c [Actinomycetota bacterium]
MEEPTTGLPGMPADLVTGEDADSVADYVSSVAALPVRAGAGEVAAGGESETEGANGEAIFAEAGCGGCHVLEAANAGGNIGPSLDDTKPAKELVVERVTNGKGAMPAFKDSYSAEQIAAVADYVVANAGK